MKFRIPVRFVLTPPLGTKEIHGSPLFSPLIEDNEAQVETQEGVVGGKSIINVRSALATRIEDRVLDTGGNGD